MADQEMEQQDFTEDYSGGDFQENGGGGGGGVNEKPESGDGKTAGDMQDSGAADAPGRDDDRKLFVGGLSWETTETELREHFKKYGDIESINVKTDPNTGRSRGFAFIVFSTSEAVDKVIDAGDHVINGKKVDPKKAKARHGKIFVGGLKPELSDDDIKTFFGQFGNIIEVEMPFDKQKNQRKGFCFITFDQEAVVTDLLKTPKQSINGHDVDVKKATPKPDSMMRGGMRGGGMRGGRGGMRGRGRGWGQGWNQGGYGGYNQGGYGGYGGYVAETDAQLGLSSGGYDYGGYGGYGGYGDYGYGYDNYGYGYGSGNYGSYQAGKGTAGGRASTGVSKRGTNRTEGRYNYSEASWNGGMY